jgi:hypothetical protein
MVVISLLPILLGTFETARFQRIKPELIQVEAVIQRIDVTKKGDDTHHQVYVSYEYRGEVYEQVPLNWWSSTMEEAETVTFYVHPDAPTDPLDDSYGHILLASGALVALISGILCWYAHMPKKVKT